MLKPLKVSSVIVLIKLNSTPLSKPCPLRDMAFFYLFIEKNKMKYCPYCGSDQLIRIDRMSAGSTGTSNTFFSSATITAICTQLARGMKIPPLIGTAVGIVVSGVAIAIQEHFTPRKLPDWVSVMLCSDCQQSFDCPHHSNQPFNTHTAS